MTVMMSSSSCGEVSVTLPRDGSREPFGFRLRGGSDLKEAFIVQRVALGSPADGELRRGDVIVKINGRPTSRMTHQEASDMIKNAGASIDLVVQRGSGNLNGPSSQTGQQQSAGSGSVSSSSITGFPFTISTKPDHSNRKVTTQSGPSSASRNISEIMLSPVENLPVTVFPGQQQFTQEHQTKQRNINYELFPFLAEEKEMDRDRERIVVTHQPYRTTPLVLPGAKVGRDTASTTQCYLALQQSQNPMLWQQQVVASVPGLMPAQQSATEALLKQKLEAAAAMVQRNLAAAGGGGHVAVSHEPGDAPPPKQEVVHKQFNSPLGLYSSENVQEALALQSGMIPHQQQQQQARQLDLKYSETLRALREENENKSRKQQQQQPQQQQPVDARGLKSVHHSPAAPIKTVASNPHFKVNVMGVEKEKIQQSYSFKRLMADVLGETDF